MHLFYPIFREKSRRIEKGQKQVLHVGEIIVIIQIPERKRKQENIQENIEWISIRN